MLFFVIDGNKAQFFGGLFMGLVLNSFIGVANPLALKYLFDEGIIQRDFKLFVTLALAFVLIFTLWRLGVYFYRLYIQRLKNVIFEKICHRMINKYFELPYDEIIKRDQGYFLSRVYDEVLSAVPPFVEISFSLFNTFVTMVVAFVVVLTLSWRAAFTILVAIPLVYAVSRKYARKIKTESKLEKEEEAKLRGILVRALGSYKIVRIFGLRNKIFTTTTNQLHNYIAAFLLRFRTSARYQTLSGMFMSYTETTAIIGAGYEMLAGRMTFGGYMGFMNAFWMVIGSAREAFNQIPELSRVAGLIERLKEFEEHDTQLVNIHYSDEVKLERVSFAYNGQNVLHDFDFKPKKGEKVLIVGPNGSGKSTLAHLIVGLLQPNTGSATTFSIDKISAVIYPCDFIPGTVRDNVSFADAARSQEIFESLAWDLGLGEHLDKDPSELSAGQKKKLEVIISLVKDADIYVFDEPLSGVDVVSKDAVMKRIFTHTQGKTVIMIMHGDAEFYGLFDRVIHLEQSARSLASPGVY